MILKLASKKLLSVEQDMWLYFEAANCVATMGDLEAGKPLLVQALDKMRLAIMDEPVLEKMLVK